MSSGLPTDEAVAFPSFLPDFPQESRAWATREAAEALLGVWRTLDALWVNHQIKTDSPGQSPSSYEPLLSSASRFPTRS